MMHAPILLRPETRRGAPSPVLVGRVLFGADRAVAAFVRERIPNSGDFGGEHPITGKLNYAALGVILDGQLVGGAVFHNYKGNIAEMSGAYDTPRWATRRAIQTILEVPYMQFGVKVLVTITGRRSKHVRDFDKRLGFREVGIVPHGWGDGSEDAVIYALTKENCRWIKPRNTEGRA